MCSLISHWWWLSFGQVGLITGVNNIIRWRWKKLSSESQTYWNLELLSTSTCFMVQYLNLWPWVLTDWLTGWLTGWLANWLTDGLTYLLTDWLTDWLTDGQMDWTDWLTDWRTDWQMDRRTDWLTDWLANWLTEWLLCQWVKLSHAAQ